MDLVGGMDGVGVQMGEKRGKWIWWFGVEKKGESEGGRLDR